MRHGNKKKSKSLSKNQLSADSYLDIAHSLTTQEDRALRVEQTNIIHLNPGVVILRHSVKSEYFSLK